MELRRLEALQNLSGATTKVIFDLAKPSSDARTMAIAAAMGENVRVADSTGLPAPTERIGSQAIEEDAEEEEEEEERAPKRPGRRA